MSDDEVPPPYSEQQELDQKVSEALSISLEQPTNSDGEDEWEEWNDAVFEAAAGHNKRLVPKPLSHHAGSSNQTPAIEPRWSRSHPLPPLPAVEPLRIRERSSSNNAFSDSSSSYDNTQSLNPNNSWRGPIMHDVSGYWEGHSISPPPFSVGPRRLEYHPDSAPPSPLTSPVLEHPPLLPNGSLLPTTNNFAQMDPFPRQSGNNFQLVHPRQSLPIPPRATSYVERRPISEIVPVSLNYSGQRDIPPHHLTSFRNDKLGIQPPPSYPSPQSFVASAFYNSAVSAHLTASVPIQPREPSSSRHVRPITSSTQASQNTFRHNAVLPNDHVHTQTPPSSLGTPAPWSTPTPKAFATPHTFQRLPAQTSHLSQYPSFPATRNEPTPPRWAMSEQELSRHFQ